MPEKPDAGSGLSTGASNCRRRYFELSLHTQVRIDVHLPPTDLRSNFDGLTGLVRAAFSADPREGRWFLFFNKRRNRVEILASRPEVDFIGSKRLEAGTFETLQAVADGPQRELDSTVLTLRLSGVSTPSAPADVAGVFE